MADALKIPAEALSAQFRSSDPGASVWVSANAGSGKTFVLAQRVVRLLLSGAAPGSILCLTYTNAAASEMAQRVFKRLAELATLDEAKLLRDVALLAPDADPSLAAKRARTLFAETLETAGGLKVQTLHAFAAALLRRFPLEANLSGAFGVLDEAMHAELGDRAIAATLAKAAAEPGGWAADCLASLQPFLSDHAVVEGLRASLRSAPLIGGWVGEAPDPTQLTADLGAALALEPGDVGEPLVDRALCEALMDAAERAGKSNGVVKALAAALRCPEGHAKAPEWPEIFLKKDGEARKTVLTKDVVAAVPGAAERLEAEAARILAKAARDKITGTIEASVPLIRLAADAIANLEAEKRRRGLIDYDDQIARAAALVGETTAAAWVRYKLDDGIDHVMVDEAQDTAPAQWELIGALVDEFFAGEGAREVLRTLFAVGDEKQSIYSFQGAAPELFAEKRHHYDAAAEGSGRPFAAVDLAHSFRSAPQILAAVDQIFASDPLATSVGARPAAVRHAAVVEAPGGVDIWPLFRDEASANPDDWDKPFDYAADSAGEIKLVNAIADQIEAWTGAEGPLGGPPLRPGEVMILARNRGTFTGRMNRALKDRFIPTAGADRLDVTQHIAVQDMLALGRALLTRDDLSLASVLKSPLFGFSEEALFQVAVGREGSLDAALATGNAEARAAHARLAKWRERARANRPFDLFAGILIGEGRRADFAARLGSEAEDALDALLDSAEAFEATGLPTLETFLFHMSRLSMELRRTPEADLDAVRVMTVHGSKGLEAKLVFLADVGSTQASPANQPRLVPLELGGEDTVLALASRKAERPDRVSEVLRQEEASREREHHRLLYVAMTRAERHLVVCGSFKKRTPQSGMWHGLVTNALSSQCEPLALPFAETDGLAWRLPHGTAGAWTAPDRPAARPVAAPAWLEQPARLRADAPEPLVPSSGHGGKALTAPDDRTLAPAIHGTLVHTLLEREPLDGAAMEALVRRERPELDPFQVAAVVNEASRTLRLPELDAGGATVRREVAVIGDVRLADGSVRRASGRIDRLEISADRVRIVDYKTDRSVPGRPTAVPKGHLLQLAIYRALVAELVPSRRVEAAIVWTAAPRYMPVTELLPNLCTARLPEPA